MNNKHHFRLVCLTMAALVFPCGTLYAQATVAPAQAGFAEGARAQARGDYEAARRAYLKAAQGGDTNAQNNLGNFYRHGRGGPVDLKQALYWFSKAAQAGQVNAQTSLADMYETGDAGAIDLSAAVSWYHRAAVSGFFVAQLSLGQMREAGRGVPKDSVAALAWFTIAARADVNPANQYLLSERGRAVELRDSLSARLSSDQRAAADDLASRWKAGYDMQQLESTAAAATTAVREQVAHEQEQGKGKAEQQQYEREVQLRERELQLREQELQRQQRQADQQEELERQQKAEHDRQVGLCVAAMMGRPTVSGSFGESLSNAAQCRLDPQAAQKIPPPSPTPPPQPAYGGGGVSGPAFYRGEQRSGFNKICMYDRLGSAVAVTVGAMEMCPRVLQ